MCTCVQPEESADETKYWILNKIKNLCHLWCDADLSGRKLLTLRRKLHLQGKVVHHEDEDTKFLRKVSNLLPNKTISHPSGQKSSGSPPGNLISVCATVNCVSQPLQHAPCQGLGVIRFISTTLTADYTHFRFWNLERTVKITFIVSI
jgi:hypothetical protein